MALFRLMFGEQAVTARSNASERLLRWAAWFDEWLLERTQMAGKKKLPLIAWGDFLAAARKAPWQAEEADVRGYIDSLREQGKTSLQIANRLTEMTSFYKFAQARGAACAETVVDPTAAVKQPPRARYPGGTYLNLQQIQALLETLRSAEDAIDRRDYAMVLLQLASALRPGELRRLRWGQVDLSGSPGGAWVRRPFRRSLPGLSVPLQSSGPLQTSVSQPFRGEGWVFREAADEAIQAVLAWLRAAARLEYIQPEDFIFCPLEIRWEKTANAAPETWDSSRPLTDLAMRQRLEYWSDLAGLQPQDVKWNSLRITALLLRVQAGDSHQEIHQRFGFSQGSVTYSMLRDRQRKARRARWQKETGSPQDGEAKPPASGANAFYAQAIPVQDLARLEQLNPGGIEGEVNSLRVLMFHSLKHALESGNTAEMVRLIEAISGATQRMANALKVQRELSGKGETDEFSWSEITRSILEEAGWEK